MRNKILKIQPIITTGYRKIKDGSKYDKYFPKVAMNDKMVVENRTAEVDDVVHLMQKVVWKYKADTEQIAKLLRGNTLEQTITNVWNFLYYHIQYKLDTPNLEELRRPARLWHDKVGDCDDYSITASSILTNLNIPNSFRITKYDRDYFQHIYVIVPHSKGYYIIDPVLSLPNYEKPFTDKKDFTMNLNGINVAVLEGLGQSGEGDLIADLLNTSLDGLEDISDKEDARRTYDYLIKTRNYVINNPSIVATVEDPKGFLKMLDYAIKYWNTPKRDEAMRVLIKNEEQLNLKNGFSGLLGDEDIYEDEAIDIDWDELDGLSNTEIEQYLSELEQDVDVAEQEFDADETIEGIGAFWHNKKKRKKLREQRKQRRKNRRTKRKERITARKTKRKKIFRKFFKSVKKGVKRGFKALVKYNPLVITARTGFLLALKLNLFKFSERLKWAYAHQWQIKGKVSEAYRQKSIKTLKQIEKVFADKLQGKRRSLKKAILNGKSGGLKGVPDNYFNDRLNEGGIGVVATGTLVTAASAIIGVVAKIFKDNDMNGDGDPEPSEIMSNITNISDTLTDPVAPEDYRGEDETSNYNPNTTSPMLPSTMRPMNTMNTQNPNAKPPSKIMKLLKDNIVVTAIGGLGILGLSAWGISKVMKGKKSKPQGIAGHSQSKKGKKAKQGTLKVEKLK